MDFNNDFKWMQQNTTLSLMYKIFETLQNGLCVTYNLFLELLLIRDDYKGWFYGCFRGGFMTNSKNHVPSCVGIPTPCVWETACHTSVCSAHTSHENCNIITHKTPSPVNIINVNYAIFLTQTFSVDWTLTLTKIPVDFIKILKWIPCFHLPLSLRITTSQVTWTH